jgi:hypothetical protein
MHVELTDCDVQALTALVIPVICDGHSTAMMMNQGRSEGYSIIARDVVIRDNGGYNSSGIGLNERG